MACPHLLDFHLIKVQCIKQSYSYPMSIDNLDAFFQKVVMEMNRLGMLVDLSHVAKQTMIDALSITKAPVIFSHSGAYSISNHYRFVQDDVLKMLVCDAFLDIQTKYLKTTLIKLKLVIKVNKFLTAVHKVIS